jgi:hypothetical protein
MTKLLVHATYQQPTYYKRHNRVPFIMFTARYLEGCELGSLALNTIKAKWSAVEVIIPNVGISV